MFGILWHIFVFILHEQFGWSVQCISVMINKEGYFVKVFSQLHRFLEQYVSISMKI